MRMLRPLDPHDRRPLGEQIADRVAEAIANGDLSPGDAPPSRNELAEHYSVAGMTAQAALSRLRDDGLISASRGKRSVVLDFEQQGRTSKLTQLDRIEQKLDEILERLERLEGRAPQDDVTSGSQSKD